jgi:hypothetical protein
MRTATRSNHRELPLRDTHVQAAHDESHTLHQQSIALGAECPDISDDDDADTRSKADKSDDDQAALDNSDNRLMQSRRLVRATGPKPRAIDTQIPNIYAAATRSGDEIRSLSDPAIFPGYQPHGTPPDIYKLGLAKRLLAAEETGQRSTVKPTTILHRDSNDIPNPYSPAAIAACAAARS